MRRVRSLTTARHWFFVWAAAFSIAVGSFTSTLPPHPEFPRAQAHARTSRSGATPPAGAVAGAPAPQSPSVETASPVPSPTDTAPASPPPTPIPTTSPASPTLAAVESPPPAATVTPPATTASPSPTASPPHEEPDEEPDGEQPDGEEPDGEEPDGEEPDGEDPDGEEPVRAVIDGRSLESHVPSRVVVPSLDIDLAIVDGKYYVRGNRDNYPLCGVAQYLDFFRVPGEPGTVWVYAHARDGMFLPLLLASQDRNGRELLGKRVTVFTANGIRFRYRITRVKRHATDWTLGTDVKPGQHRLVLQTSEGPRGTVPKLQVAADLVEVASVERSEANPRPRPYSCD